MDVVTVAVLFTEPAAPPERTTRIRTTAPDPAGSVPRSAVTVPVVPGVGPLQVPSVVWQETKTVSAGSGSTTVVLTAGAGPALSTEIV